LSIPYFHCYSQTVEEEIDSQIWTPFTKAWEANDANAYNEIHSKDVWRINPGRLLIGQEYKDTNSKRMNGTPSGNRIEFSFETRTSNKDNAYEVGYYRIIAPGEDGNRYFVGRFHVALKKIDGQWKITQDWDTDEVNGIKITPESLNERSFIHFE
ncbi:MAG: nuclear transport factor 2 family protein, partial [Bacteroidota bacterium]